MDKRESQDRAPRDPGSCFESLKRTRQSHVASINKEDVFPHTHLKPDSHYRVIARRAPIQLGNANMKDAFPKEDLMLAVVRSGSMYFSFL